MTGPNRPAAPIIAGAALLALDVAIDRWQNDSAERSLAERIDESFDQSRTLTDLD